MTLWGRILGGGITDVATRQQLARIRLLATVDTIVTLGLVLGTVAIATGYQVLLRRARSWGPTPDVETKHRTSA